MKIKSWFIWIIAGTVSLFMLIQICFYILFQHWNGNMRDSLIEATAHQSAEQVGELYKSIEDISVQIMTDSYVLDYLLADEADRTLKDHNLILNNLSSLIFANKDIRYVGLIDEENIILNVSQTADMLAYLSILDTARTDLPREGNNQTTVRAYQHGEVNCFAYLSPIRLLNSSQATATPYYVVIMFEVGEVENYLEPVFDRKKFTLRVLDYQDKILLSGYDGEFGQTFNRREHTPGSWCKMITLEKPEWKLCFSIPKSSFGSEQRSFLVFMLCVILLNILLLIVLIKILIKNISESISDIEAEIGVICNGNWGHRVRYQRNNELNSIATSLNTLLDEYELMVRKNSEMEEEIHTAKLLQLEAQIEQLQEKISPHFLYNSMEYIKGVAQEHGVDKIADITSVLSRNFRYNMDDRKEATVKEDLFYALSYFNVVNARRKNPIRLQNQIPTEIMEMQLIKMVFQPLLENTLKHGDLGEGGTVWLSGGVSENGLVKISVKDNGQGISDETQEKLNASLVQNVNYIKNERGDHQGLMNVHMRLKLTYGKDCGISVRSVYGEGTEIIVTFKCNG